MSAAREKLSLVVNNATSAEMTAEKCPFCDRVAAGGLLVAGVLTASFLDAYPLNPGHALVVPRRHVASFWDLDRSEITEMFAVASSTREAIDARFAPDGYNLGVNVGETAGQTIFHANLHLIPRYRGDDSDPRGGVRWILPDRAVHGGGRPGCLQ